jgi:hypothetical protein
MICDRPYGQGKDILAAAKELAGDARYDQEMTNRLLTAFAAGGIGPTVDMDAAVDAPETAAD